MQEGPLQAVTVLVDRNVPMSQFALALNEAGLAIRCDGTGLHVEPVRETPAAAPRKVAPRKPPRKRSSASGERKRKAKPARMAAH